MIPLHYDDSCIFFEMFDGTKAKMRQYAQAYFYDINTKWKTIISSLTLGEITRGLLKLKEKERQTSLENLNDHAFKKMVQITSSQFEDYKLALELKKIDYKLEPADALHLAIAINNKAQFFITMGERDLVSNEKIKEFCKERGLRFKVLGG